MEQELEALSDMDEDEQEHGSSAMEEDSEANEEVAASQAEVMNCLRLKENKCVSS